MYRKSGDMTGGMCHATAFKVTGRLDAVLNRTVLQKVQ
jgi:hypothetical protein